MLYSNLSTVGMVTHLTLLQCRLCVCLADKPICSNLHRVVQNYWSDRVLQIVCPPKGGFFSESTIRFLSLQISKKNIPKNYPELEI